MFFLGHGVVLSVRSVWLWKEPFLT